jgi:hypothetical protein
VPLANNNKLLILLKNLHPFALAGFITKLFCNFTWILSLFCKERKKKWESYTIKNFFLALYVLVQAAAGLKPSTFG